MVNLVTLNNELTEKLKLLQIV